MEASVRTAAAVMSTTMIITLGCTADQLPPDMPPQEQIESYLQSAAHLNEEQQTALRRHRPFVGMTLEEADLAMVKESSEITLGGETLNAVYRGRKGTRYHLVFQGDPPVLVDWSYFSAADIELTDPDKLRPQPRGIP